MRIDAESAVIVSDEAGAADARQISASTPQSTHRGHAQIDDASISQSAPDNISSATAARRERTGGTRTTNSERPRTNAMSGPGLFEPGEEYVPAGIKPVVDEATLPTAPAAGGEELWLIQIPGDADPADLDGLRFRISDEGNGPEISQFKAGGESFIAFEPPSASHPRPCRPPPNRPPQQPSPPAALFGPFSADEPDPLPLTGRAGKKWRLKEDDAITASTMFVLPSKKAGGRQEFGGPRRITRRITMNRRNIGIEDAAANEEGAKTPGEKKEKKRKKDKDDKGDKKSSKKSKK